MVDIRIQIVIVQILFIAETMPAPQGSTHGGQPQAGAVLSTLSPITGGSGPTGTGAGTATLGNNLPPLQSPPASGIGVGVGGLRVNYGGWREWRRADPTLINTLWRNKMGNGIRKQLGNAEVYIMLALLIGLATVVIGCWLSDNCWSPEPEHVVTVA